MPYVYMSGSSGEGSGGASVQPDWNQNDETQPDYVKNRPCYKVEETEEITWDGDTTGREEIP